MAGHLQPGRPHEIVLSTDEAVARRARRFVEAAVTDLGRPDVAAVGALLVSELVTNVIRHTAAATCRVCLGAVTDASGARAPSVVVEVVDGDEGADVAPGPPAGADEEHGRGLRIVAALADDWGVRQAATEKSVWFRLGSTEGP